MRPFPGVLAMLAFAAVGGCVTPPNYPSPNYASPNYEASAPQPPVNAPYRLASGDCLRVIVFGQDDLSNNFSVDGARVIAMPLAGRVRARGLTTAELERAIEARLRQGYLREPSVSVEVAAFRPFFILGEVGVPGQHPFIGGMTVQNAIAVAGGFAPRAVQDSVDITRTVDGRAATFLEPLSFRISPGDTITVREGYF